jgi:Rrf2 family protein
MKMSTRGRYGLRVMLELALRDGKDPVLMSDIAEAQHISRKYMHSLLSRLKGAGLVRAVRGMGGGYLLNRKPVDITVFEILETLEGSLYPLECTFNPQVCPRIDICVARDVWMEIKTNIENLLKGMTLEDLINRHHAKNEQSLMYDI